MRSHLQSWHEFEHIIRGRPKYSVRASQRRVEEFIAWIEAQGRPTLPGAVSRGDVGDYLRALFYDRANSNATRAAKLAAVRSFFTFLTYRGAIPSDPTAGIPSPRIERRMPRKFTKEQLRKLFAAPDTTTALGLRDRALLMTIYGAGLRKSELVGLNLGDISDTGVHISLRIFGKRGKERMVPLRRTPAAALRRWIAYRMGWEVQDTAVFIALKGPPRRLSHSSVSKTLKKYARRTRIPTAEAFVHKLRATWATDLYDSGLREREIAELAGWSDIQTANRYIAISERVLRKGGIPDRRWKELVADDAAAGEVR